MPPIPPSPLAFLSSKLVALGVFPCRFPNGFTRVLTEHFRTVDVCQCAHERCFRTQPNTLADYRHKPALSILVFKSIYEKYSSDNLLNRCMGGFTQNSNKSFNATGQWLRKQFQVEKWCLILQLIFLSSSTIMDSKYYAHYESVRHDNRATIATTSAWRPARIASNFRSCRCLML